MYCTMVATGPVFGSFSVIWAGSDALGTLHANLPGAAYQCGVSAPWTISYISPGVLELTGHPPEAFLSGHLSWGAITHPEDLARLTAEVDAAVAARRPFSASYRIQCAVGEEKWVEERGEAVCDPAGEPLSLVGFIRDVSLQKRTEERLLEAQSHYKWALQSSEHLSWTTDPEGQSVQMSDEFFHRLSVSSEQDPRVGWPALLHPDDRAATLEDWSRALEIGSPIDQRFRLRQKNGEFRWYRARGAPIKGPDGAIVKWQGTTEDINSQVEAETSKAMEEAKRSHLSQDSGMNLMAGTLAHELNQPLAAATNYIGAGAALFDTAGAIDVLKVKERLEQAKSQIFRASDIIQRVRSLMMGQRSATDVISVRELIYRSWEMALISGACPNVSFKVSISRSATKVLGDQVQLEQVLLNLFRNACSAMSQAETPTINVRADKYGEDFAKITVVDTGTGLSAEAETSLFTAYTHSSNGGLGIGLSISRTIVETHGGRIWAESNPGKGTSFLFTVPAPRALSELS